jgi:hypothetical protein
MTGAPDTVLVGLALGVSVLYATYALGPKALKRWLLAGAARLLGRLAPPWAARAQAKAAALAAGAGGACGGCGNCGSAKTPGTAQAAGAGSLVGARADEVRIPVSRIGRR